MKHLAIIQREFLKMSGFMGLEHWSDSDEAAEFVDKLAKAVKKNKDINELVAKQIKRMNNEYNTSGAINVALAIESEGKDEVPKFSHLLSKDTIDDLIRRLKKQGTDDEGDIDDDYDRMIDSVQKIRGSKSKKQQHMRRGPRGGKYYESGGHKTYIQ
jgi:polyhydroxyalkanoate synthesis regulator phasin